MRIITTREKIYQVADRWEKQYAPGRPYHSEQRMAQLLELRQLDLSTATVADVGEIISASWVEVTCHECGKIVDCVVQLGEEPDWESATACICADCLAKAARLMPVIP